MDNQQQMGGMPVNVRLSDARDINCECGNNVFMEGFRFKKVSRLVTGGAKDAVIDQVTGLLVDGTNVDQISNVICELLADPIRSKAMGEAGRGWVISNWQLSTWSEKFNKLLLTN